MTTTPANSLAGTHHPTCPLRSRARWHGLRQRLTTTTRDNDNDSQQRLATTTTTRNNDNDSRHTTTTVDDGNEYR
jgi:hypothetical protein